MLNSDEVRMLVDLGFVAVTRGMEAQAAAIFDGVQAIRPDQDASYIGPALILMNKGDVASAIKLLRSRPPSDSIRLFLGMALLRLGEIAEGEAVLHDLVATAREPALVELGNLLLASAGDSQRPLTPR